MSYDDLITTILAICLVDSKRKLRHRPNICCMPGGDSNVDAENEL